MHPRLYRCTNSAPGAQFQKGSWRTLRGSMGQVRVEEGMAGEIDAWGGVLCERIEDLLLVGASSISGETW